MVGSACLGFPNGKPDPHGLWALIVIALFVLLLVSGDRLALLGKGLSDGVRAFRKTVRRTQDEPDPGPPRRVIVVSAEPKQLEPGAEIPGERSQTDDGESQKGP